MANTILAPEIWAEKLLETINPINVALNFANQAYTEDVYRMGDRVSVVTPGSVSTGEFIPASGITISSLTDTKESLVIDDTLHWAFEVNDIERVQANPGMVESYMKQAGKKLSRDIDTYLFAAHVDALSANELTGASGAAYVVTGSSPTQSMHDLIVDASVALGKQDAPVDNRWIVVSPVLHGQLLKDKENFVGGSQLGDTVVTTGRFGESAGRTPGFVGRIANFDVYVSANLPTSGANVYCIYGQGQPISYVSQLNEIKVSDVPNGFGVYVKQLVLHGKKVFAEDAKRLGSILVKNS